MKDAASLMAAVRLSRKMLEAQGRFWRVNFRVATSESQESKQRLWREFEKK
jgi:hypothetical protein